MSKSEVTAFARGVIITCHLKGDDFTDLELMLNDVELFDDVWAYHFRFAFGVDYKKILEESV